MAELVGEHADLTAVVGLVGDHVAEHLGADGPRLSPSITTKGLGASFRIERFGEHRGTELCAYGERGAGLLRSAPGAVESRGRLEVRGGQADPFHPNVVHVGEDGRDGADLAGRPGGPDVRVEMLDEKLIEAVVDGKDPGGVWSELLKRNVLHFDDLWGID